MKRYHTSGRGSGIGTSARGVQDGQDEVAVGATQGDQRTNQLINELYHDRARLEKVVENAAKLASEAAESIANVLGEQFPGEGVEPLTQNLADLIMDAARLRQFADENND